MQRVLQEEREGMPLATGKTPFPALGSESTTHWTSRSDSIAVTEGVSTVAPKCAEPADRSLRPTNGLFSLRNRSPFTSIFYEEKNWTAEILAMGQTAPAGQIQPRGLTRKYRLIESAVTVIQTSRTQNMTPIGLRMSKGRRLLTELDEGKSLLAGRPRDQ
jgi:hypothetical protein